VVALLFFLLGVANLDMVNGFSDILSDYNNHPSPHPKIHSFYIQFQDSRGDTYEWSGNFLNRPTFEEVALISNIQFLKAIPKELEDFDEPIIVPKLGNIYNITIIRDEISYYRNLKANDGVNVDLRLNVPKEAKANLKKIDELVKEKRKKANGKSKK
jgi:hypothetical protein